jgi:hypothetical protein
MEVSNGKRNKIIRWHNTTEETICEFEDRAIGIIHTELQRKENI